MTASLDRGSVPRLIRARRRRQRAGLAGYFLTLAALIAIAAAGWLSR